MRYYRVRLKVASHVEFDVEAETSGDARVKALARYNKAMNGDPDDDLTRIDDRLSDNRQPPTVKLCHLIMPPDTPSDSPS